MRQKNPKANVCQWKLRVITREELAIVFVSNTGESIPEDIADKLFQPFFTTKEPGEGTGLGLSISKSIIEAHGGDLYLDKSANLTTFIVEIPLSS